jgi:hypothetical protein
LTVLCHGCCSSNCAFWHLAWTILMLRNPNGGLATPMLQ